jgi:hypothetical protein
MTRKELVCRFVLNEIGDDYENLEHIRSLIAKEAERCGLVISIVEIAQALVDLMEAGLAKAYKLTPTRRTAEEVPSVPSLDRIGEYYFWATPKGIELQVSDGDWYPFDENGELRKDWVVPTQ